MHESISPERNEKLAEQLGFRRPTSEELAKSCGSGSLSFFSEGHLDCYWRYPDGSVVPLILPIFFNDIMACEEWIFPVLFLRKLWLEIIGDGIIGYEFRIHPLASNQIIARGQDAKLAAAIFLAVERLIWR